MLLPRYSTWVSSRSFLRLCPRSYSRRILLHKYSAMLPFKFSVTGTPSLLLAKLLAHFVCCTNDLWLPRFFGVAPLRVCGDVFSHWLASSCHVTDVSSTGSRPCPSRSTCHFGCHELPRYYKLGVTIFLRGLSVIQGPSVFRVFSPGNRIPWLLLHLPSYLSFVCLFSLSAIMSLGPSLFVVLVFPLVNPIRHLHPTSRFTSSVVVSLSRYFSSLSLLVSLPVYPSSFFAV